MVPLLIEGLDGKSGAAVRGVSDDRGAYAAALIVTPAAMRLSFLRMPSGVERTEATGCTAPVDRTGTLDRLEAVHGMALGKDHVYALLSTWHGKRYAIVRAPR